jgi:ketosteroid isomerase-like protein
VKMLKLAVTALALLVMLPVGAGAQSADPGSVAAALAAAVNAGNVDVALALFADDGVVTLLPPASPTAKHVYTGKAEIRAWLQTLRDQRFQVQEGTPQVSGERLRSLDRISEDGLRMLGVAPLETTKEVVVRGGKITAFSSTLTPASLARLQAAVARAQSAPTQLPRTGWPGNALTSVGVALGAGGLLVALGPRVSRRARRTKVSRAAP